MPFMNKGQEDDDELPGSGLHVDLASRFCPECRKEALPWQETCEDCGVPPVTADELPSSSFPLPAHLLEGLDDEPTSDEDDAGAQGADDADRADDRGPDVGER